jgi:hypothetical protein
VNVTAAPKPAFSGWKTPSSSLSKTSLLARGGSFLNRHGLYLLRR